MTGLCANPAYDPDWWDVDADPLDRCVANGICARCAIRAACVSDALRSDPPARGLWGCRWFAPEAEETRPIRREPQDLDEIAIELACQGDDVHLTRAERVEGVRRLREKGMSENEIGRRLHINPRTVVRHKARTRQEVTS